MSQKTLIVIFMFIGSTIGGLIPSLWDSGLFSFSSLVLSAVGAFAGIYVGYKLGERY